MGLEFGLRWDWLFARSAPTKIDRESSRVESERDAKRDETRRDETRIRKESRPENIIDRDMREETRSNYEKRVSRRKFIVIIHRKK